MFILRAQSKIWKATAPVAVGQLIGALLILAVFALLGRFDTSVLLGSIAGGVLAFANYYFLYLFATRAAERAEHQDVTGGQKLIQLSYMGRMIALFVILLLLAKSGQFHVITLVIPLALNRPILTIHEMIRKKEGANE